MLACFPSWFPSSGRTGKEERPERQRRKPVESLADFCDRRSDSFIHSFLVRPPVGLRQERIYRSTPRTIVSRWPSRPSARLPVRALCRFPFVVFEPILPRRSEHRPAEFLPHSLASPCEGFLSSRLQESTAVPCPERRKNSHVCPIHPRPSMEQNFQDTRL